MSSNNQATLASTKPQLQLESYSGPLDLLLSLIEQRQLDITTISLARVAEQYMQAVAAVESPDPDVIAEFLVIGAKLLVIKTRALLPRPPVEVAPRDEEDVGDQLARQLIEYRRFKQAATQLRTWEQENHRAYARRAAPPIPPRKPPAKLDVSMSDLLAAIQRRLQLMLPIEDDPVAMPAPKIITIADVRARLRDVLRQQTWISFEDLLSLAMSRNEVIVTLWTVLESFKRGMIVFEQEQLFARINIGRGPAFDSNAALSDEPDEEE
ncbi:MAG: segregation/condensation protein A [Chloroflexi bacterium]|nr:segregation/condensation protein A [Chloroflexota bacterium]